MSKKPKKILLIGVDQTIPFLIKKFMGEGILPNILKLVENGVYAEAYPCPPCDTPTNWTTIATGASTAIHGATSFYLHLPGEPLEYGLNHRSRSSLSKYCKAEYFWETADNHGLKPFVLNYPGGWPGNLKNGCISLLTWPLPESFPRELTMQTALEFGLNASNPILKAINFKKRINNLSPPLEISIELKNKTVKKFPPIKAYIVDTANSGYNTLFIPSNKVNREQILVLDKWSDWIFNEVSTIYGILPCLFKIKIKEISPKGDRLVLYLTSLYNTIGWTNPEIFGEKIVRNAIIYELARKNKVDYMISGKIKSFLSLARKEVLTIAQTVSYMKNDMNWDVCFFHIHTLDSVNHSTLGYLYKKSPMFTEKKESKALEHIRTAYQLIDELVKLLVKSCVDEDTIVVFLSDHGALPSWRVVNLLPTLIDNGLLRYKWDDIQKNFTVDWKNTKAFPYLEPPYIWINLKGRDPYGIVEPKDYESVREQIIEALYQLKDPDTGKSIVKTAIKKEDASDLGQNGDRIGDVIYFLNPSYQLFDYRLEQLNPAIQPPDLLEKPEAYNTEVNCAAHAYYLPNAKLGDYTVSVPMIINGPGIEKGFEVRKIVKLIDIAPTLSYALQISEPKQSQGRVIHEFFK